MSGNKPHDTVDIEVKDNANSFEINVEGVLKGEEGSGIKSDITVVESNIMMPNKTENAFNDYRQSQYYSNTVQYVKVGGTKYYYYEGNLYKTLTPHKVEYENGVYYVVIVENNIFLSSTYSSRLNNSLSTNKTISPTINCNGKIM